MDHPDFIASSLMENSLGRKRIKLLVFRLSNLEQKRVDAKLIMLDVKLSMVWLLFLYHHNLSRGVEIAVSYLPRDKKVAIMYLSNEDFICLKEQIMRKELSLACTLLILYINSLKKQHENHM